jgi:nucleoid-associated protein YgaU
MKSSTLYRSNLSKEKMILLEELRAKSGQGNFKRENTPDVYIRPSKEKELDVLWQNFKVNQKEEKSPGVYLLTGFIAGALSMFLMTALLSFASNAINNNSTESPKLVKRVKPAKEAKISIIPADQVVEEAKTISPETYTVKSGDTLEGIVIRFYGSYDASKIEKIMEANNLLNPNQLSIGQSLIIPLE